MAAAGSGFGLSLQRLGQRLIAPVSSRRTQQALMLLATRGVHSDTTIHRHDGFRVHQFPILSDNYSYLIVDEVTNEAVAVDPADPERTLAEVEDGELSLTAVLCTHKHWDHAQGNEALAAHISGLRVVGPALEECPAVTERVSGSYDAHLSVIKASPAVCRAR
jgi:glyoxylase-like metal-dependent hydrolase (beta-lactamase superfamily II)